MSDKFSSIIAEASYFIASNGFALEEEGTVESGIGWNALVDVSPVILYNLDADAELIERLREESDEDGFLAWIREDTYGFVDVVMFDTDNGLRPGTDLVNRHWDEFVENYEKSFD